MKTLDEVIDALEVCSQMDAECDKCPYHATAKGWCEEKDRDALHYLRELQLFRETPLMQGIHKAQNEYALYPVSDWGKDEPDFNPALTWDELRHMEGKPVWVEEQFSNEWHGRWEVISTINDTEFWDEDEKNIWMTDEECRYKSNYGKTWQAYRKERG